MEQTTEDKFFEEALAEVLTFFDFEKVHKTMKALDWNWNLGEDGYGIDCVGIPNVETLKARAEMLLRKTYTEGVKVATSGSFYASYDEGMLRLEFILEAYDENINPERSSNA